jgi:hypothetical protein
MIVIYHSSSVVVGQIVPASSYISFMMNCCIPFSVLLACLFSIRLRAAKLINLHILPNVSPPPPRVIRSPYSCFTLDESMTNFYITLMMTKSYSSNLTITLVRLLPSLINHALSEPLAYALAHHHASPDL